MNKNLPELLPELIQPGVTISNTVNCCVYIRSIALCKFTEIEEIVFKDG